MSGILCHPSTLVSMFHAKDRGRVSSRVFGTGVRHTQCGVLGFESMVYRLFIGSVQLALIDS
jgi:hypothetical protein